MGMLDHWHPVSPSKDLRKKPIEVKLAGRSICLFRTTKGVTAALDNTCPHRRLKLSYGRVVGERLECKYHGWQFDAMGEGEVPSTPKMHTCTTSYETREEHGYVWLKNRESDPVFPKINEDNYYHIGTARYIIPAPLELTVDNFNEIEHSGTVHDTFGYDLEHLHEVRVRFESDDEKVRVINVGPTKRIPKIFSWLLGIRRGDLFHDDWTTRFSPVYSVFDHWWTSPDETREAMIRWRIYIFFSPIDEDRTFATAFSYAKSKYPGPTGGLRIAKYIFRKEIDREIKQDISMLEHMADKSPGIEGMKLTRFDKVMGLTRDRIARIYRGDTSSRISVA